MAKRAKDLYDSFENSSTWYLLGSLEHGKQQEAKVFHKWNECFKLFTPKQSTSNTAKILENTTVKYSEYINDLNRKIICIDDCRSVLTNRNKFRVIYTDDETYLTKDPSFEPEEEVTGINLFTFE